MTKQTFSPSEIGRIDKLLSTELKISRTKVQKAIKAGDILVDGEQVTPHFEITSEHVVQYDDDLQAVRKKTIFEPPKIVVIYEDDDVLVVNKPARLLVHPTEISDEPTLHDGLVAYAPESKDIGDKPERAGIVHRLDKAASGVLITAKTQKAFDFLKEQFKERKVEKHYTTLVHGTLERDSDVITFPIERSKTTGRMAAKPISQGGKEAITHYRVVERFKRATLLDVKIETGRTHQIRAHMFAIEHPIVGDFLYKPRNQKLKDLGRIFLHARELTITIPSGEEKTFVAPLPRELEQVLESYRV